MSTTAERIRFTIAVDSDVYEAFADLAHTSGVSLSRCIGDWLRDTAEAAQITTVRLNEIRKTPQDALNAFLRDAIVPETLAIRERIAAGTFWKPGFGPDSRSSPRPVIRGGKSPEQGKKVAGKRS